MSLCSFICISLPLWFITTTVSLLSWFPEVINEEPTKKKCTTYEFLVLFIFYFIFFIGTILILPSLISLMVPWLINKILHKKKRKLTMYESPILFFSFFRLCIFCLPFIASILTYMSFILPMGVISKRQDIK